MVGKPSLLRAAVLGRAFSAEIRLVNPPWPIQWVTYALLAPIARLCGFAHGRSQRPQARS